MYNGSISRAMTVDELNLAIIAEQKRADGQSLNGAERERVAQFRDLYRDVSEVGRRPEVRRALLDVLENDLSFLTEVPKNPLLTEHLRALRTGETVLTRDGVATLRSLAKRVSEKEDEAISATLTALALRGAITADAYADATHYLESERASRGQHVRSKKRNGWLLAAGAVVATVVGVPLLFWLTPIGGAVAGLGAAAAKGVQLGALFGSLVTGLGLGAIFKRSANRAAASYGDND
jgi:hypothetical protein